MSTQEQRNEKAFDEWAKEWWFDDGVDNSTRTACRYAWKAAEAAAIERCAKVCDEYAADQWSLYKGRPPYNGSEEGRANQRVEGKSDGADACAQAIRALLPKEV